MYGLQSATVWSKPQETILAYPPIETYNNHIYIIHFTQDIFVTTLSGKYWSFMCLKPRHPFLFLPHEYRSPRLVWTVAWPSPQVTDFAKLFGWKADRPKSVCGINFGVFDICTSGPTPSNPKPHEKTSCASEANAHIELVWNDRLSWNSAWFFWALPWSVFFTWLMLIILSTSSEDKTTATPGKTTHSGQQPWKPAIGFL